VCKLDLNAGAAARPRPRSLPRAHHDVKRISATSPLACTVTRRAGEGGIAGAGSPDGQAVETANAWLAYLNRAARA
jgi:hypothetical protein